MEFEDDLRRLRWNAAPLALRERVLREARAAAPSRRALIPPWFAALERHWLYPGRAPAAALVMAWLVIATLRFSTPASLLPISHVMSPLNADDVARLELERARFMAELTAGELEPDSSPTPALPPRS